MLPPSRLKILHPLNFDEWGKHLSKRKTTNNLLNQENFQEEWALSQKHSATGKTASEAGIKQKPMYLM
jgi:hypothetical protein